MDNERKKGADSAFDDVKKSIIRLDEIENVERAEEEFEDNEIKEKRKFEKREKLLREIPTIRKNDFQDGKYEYYLGLIYIYRRIAIEAEYFSNDIANTIRGTHRPALVEFDDYYSFGEEIYNFNWDDLDNLIDTAYKFSGRKKDRLRQEARDYGLKLKQELLQRGKSNREANTIVIDRLEQHPIYGNYVKDLGKEALRKLLQIPKTPKEKNGK